MENLYLSYRITQCYLPPYTGVMFHFNPSQVDWCFPQRDGRLSWPWRLVIYWGGLSFFSPSK